MFMESRRSDPKAYDQDGRPPRGYRARVHEADVAGAAFRSAGGCEAGPGCREAAGSTGGWEDPVPRRRGRHERPCQCQEAAGKRGWLRFWRSGHAA